MDINTAPAAPDNRLTEQLVVQETKAVRAEITRLRLAYLEVDGEKPSESAAVRRLIRKALPIAFKELGFPEDSAPVDAPPVVGTGSDVAPLA